MNYLLPWTNVLKSGKTQQEGGDDSEDGQRRYPFMNLFFAIFFITLGICAGFLCWQCNEGNDLGLRVIYTGLAFFNAIPYLLYYFIIRVVLQAKCHL